jgi:large subunit ribosomal protein L23
MTATRKPLGKEGLMNVLLAPHVTEKTSLGLQERNQYAFRVRREATRTDVRRAVELMFEVKVEGRFGNRNGRTQDWKKAYVRLAAGQSIDYEAQAQSQAKRQKA